MTEDEKKVVRATALRLAGTADGTVGTQMSQLVAEIGKADWPRAWPDLVRRPQCPWHIALCPWHVAE